MDTLHCREIGEYAEAETMYRKVLTVQLRVLGPEDPDTLCTLNMLALALMDQGKTRQFSAMRLRLSSGRWVRSTHAR